MDKTKQILLIWFVAMTVVFVGIGLAVRNKYASPAKNVPSASGINTGTIENTYNQIADCMNKITVSIYEGGLGGSQPQLLGSGMVISRQCVLTNRHIIENRANLFVTIAAPSGSRYPVVVYRSDPASDLALLQVTNNADFPVIGMLGNSDGVDVGDIIFAMGNAFGKGNLLIAGMIMGTNYSYTVNGQGYTGMFRTNINNYPGTCGGPLVNISGEIIAVTNSSGCTANTYMGISYATPIRKALPLLAAAGQGNANPAMPAAYSTNPYTLV